MCLLGHSCLLLAVDCKDVSLVVDCVSLASSDLELENCWELLHGMLGKGDLGIDAGNSCLLLVELFCSHLWLQDRQGTG